MVILFRKKSVKTFENWRKKSIITIKISEFYFFAKIILIVGKYVCGKIFCRKMWFRKICLTENLPSEKLFSEKPPRPHSSTIATVDLNVMVLHRYFSDIKPRDNGTLPNHFNINVLTNFKRDKNLRWIRLWW